MYTNSRFLVHRTRLGCGRIPVPRLASGSVKAVKTHLDIDEDLLAEAMRRGGHQTKRAAVHVALYEYIQQRKRIELLGLRGQVRWEGDLDQMRKNRFS